MGQNYFLFVYLLYLVHMIWKKNLTYDTLHQVTCELINFKDQIVPLYVLFHNIMLYFNKSWCDTGLTYISLIFKHLYLRLTTTEFLYGSRTRVLKHHLDVLRSKSKRSTIINSLLHFYGNVYFGTKIRKEKDRTKRMLIIRL